jgi:serine/threonine-protein kinase
MQDVLQGLVAIHEATDEKGRSLELVHRDISPPNVLVGADGVARVLDFGIAIARERIEETDGGKRKGKLGYMAPEQLRGERVTQRSDVFCAGIVLWELLAQRRLFPADQAAERTAAVLQGDYPEPGRFRSELPAKVSEIAMQALALRPQDRFGTMREFLDALEAAAARANARKIADWVNDLAREALAERTKMVARVENWRSGPDLALSSSPFAADAPLSPPAPAAPVLEAVTPPRPRLSSIPAGPMPTSSPLAQARAPVAAPRKQRRQIAPWLVLGLIFALFVVVYFAARGS